jgi:hypothetical protein
MWKIVVRALFAGILCGVFTAYADKNAVAEDGKWDAVVGEISEAVHAVGEATVDTSKKVWKVTKEGTTEAWEATEEESVKVWGAAKEKSKAIWEKGKFKLHDATAPEAAKPEDD